MGSFGSNHASARPSAFFAVAPWPETVTMPFENPDRGVGSVRGQRGLDQEALGLRRLAVARLVDGRQRVGQALGLHALGQLLLDRRHKDARGLGDPGRGAEHAFEVLELALGAAQLRARRFWFVSVSCALASASLIVSSARRPWRPRSSSMPSWKAKSASPPRHRKRQHQFEDAAQQRASRTIRLKAS